MPQDKKIYKYTKITDEKEPSQSKILKEGITAEFTMGDISRDVAYLTKQKNQLKAMIKVEAGIMTNIERDMPAIKVLSDEILQLHFIYQKAKSTVKVGTEKVTEIEDQIADYIYEIDQIQTQTGIAPTPIIVDVQKNEQVKDLLSEKNANQEGGANGSV